MKQIQTLLALLGACATASAEPVATPQKQTGVVVEAQVTDRFFITLDGILFTGSGSCSSRTSSNGCGI